MDETLSFDYLRNGVVIPNENGLVRCLYLLGGRYKHLSTHSQRLFQAFKNGLNFNINNI
jgi:hypothetical protein